MQDFEYPLMLQDWIKRWVSFLDADSLEMVAYKEFAADKVVINCIQASDGQKQNIGIKNHKYIKEYQHRKFSF